MIGTKKKKKTWSYFKTTGQVKAYITQEVLASLRYNLYRMTTNPYESPYYTDLDRREMGAKLADVKKFLGVE